MDELEVRLLLPFDLRMAENVILLALTRLLFHLWGFTSARLAEVYTFLTMLTFFPSTRLSHALISRAVNH